MKFKIQALECQKNNKKSLEGSILTILKKRMIHHTTLYQSYEVLL